MRARGGRGPLQPEQRRGRRAVGARSGRRQKRPGAGLTCRVRLDRLRGQVSVPGARTPLAPGGGAPHREGGAGVGGRSRPLQPGTLPSPPQRPAPPAEPPAAGAGGRPAPLRDAPFSRTTFKEFAERHGRDQRFRLVQKRKDQEHFFNQFILTLKRRDKENRLRLRKMR